MRWTFGILLFLLVFQPIDLSYSLTPWVKPVNDLCLRLAPDTSYRAWYQAIVCGKNLPPSLEKNWFQQTGLIHVIVVSGSHLVFLEDILRFFRLPGKIRWILLLLFSLASNLQPPITRALVQRSLVAFSQHRRLGLRTIHLQLLAGLVTLALFPSWWTSLSFMMSWICVLALSLPLPSSSALWRAALIYLFMMPAVLHVQIPHPASVLFNFVFAPILGLILFPMSLIGFIHPLFSDLCWQTLFFIFSTLPLPESHNGILFSSLWLVFYLVFIQLASFGWLIHSRRRLWKRISF